MPLLSGDEYSVKIRSASKGDRAIVEQSDKGHLVLSFPEPVRAAAKGQSVVLYKDNLVVGGGFIASATAK
ncbi:MAG: aminomethyltransferase beta-barrel domain-containing protein [Oscillospiraceae bacterium]